jgi:uncharacterized protein (TIGR02996 family)
LPGAILRSTIISRPAEDEPMTPEELALLSAIHADPKNDTPRLAYAAWLQANGQPDAAEFIRIQCQEPYFKLDTADDTAKLSHDTWWAYRDHKLRVNRAIELLNRIYGSTRYPKLRHMYWEEYVRGLPLYHDEIDDYCLDQSFDTLNPLARLDLTLRTARLAEWLAHPVMARVDKLHLWPKLPPDAEPDEQRTMNPHYDAFWAENIPVLAASAVIDRLEELNPCGCHSTGELTNRSAQNLALCRELLEPRVHVEYSY